MPLQFSVEQVIKPIVADTLQFAGRAEARRYILSPRLLCIGLGEHFICVPPPPLPTRKAEQSRIFHRLIHLAACSLIYNTDNNNIPRPFNSQPASVSFHRSSHETFLPRQPLYWHLSNSSLHCWFFYRTRRDIPPG